MIIFHTNTRQTNNTLKDETDRLQRHVADLTCKIENKENLLELSQINLDEANQQISTHMEEINNQKRDNADPAEVAKWCREIF